MKLTPEQRAELKTRLRTPEPKKKKVAKHPKSFQQCRFESSLNWNGKLIRI